MTCRVLICMLLTVAMVPHAAWAQFGSSDESESGVFENYQDPPQELPPIPVVEEENLPESMQPVGAEEGYAVEFPELPPSRVCKKKDVLGMWKLSMVFESPPGIQLDDFGEYPYQYVVFYDNSITRMQKSAREEKSEAAILRDMQINTSKVLEQFVVDKSGVIYFYKDGVAVDSLACFIVADPVAPFVPGQMLFMPPPEKADVPMVKVYEKVYNAPKNNNKKNKKRRRRK
ncbi:MAG: hypothetical protein AB7L92_07250 [Alphaproteobacteria bacterium]